jgi:hypothetical protein
MKCADVLPITHTPAGTRPLRLSTRRWADNSEMANCKATDLSRRPLFCEVGLQDPYRSCKDARDTLNTDCCVHFGRQIQFCSLTLVCRLCAMTNEWRVHYQRMCDLRSARRVGSSVALHLVLSVSRRGLQGQALPSSFFSPIKYPDKSYNSRNCTIWSGGNVVKRVRNNWMLRLPTGSWTGDRINTEAMNNQRASHCSAWYRCNAKGAKVVRTTVGSQLQGNLGLSGVPITFLAPDMVVLSRWHSHRLVTRHEYPLKDRVKAVTQLRDTWQLVKLGHGDLGSCPDCSQSSWEDITE